MQRTIVFKDAKRTKVVIEIEITDGRLSMSGQYGNGSGQIVDDMKPANAAQQDLVNLWREHHLNDMKPGTPAQMAALKSPEYEAFKKEAQPFIDKAKANTLKRNNFVDNLVLHAGGTVRHLAAAESSFAMDCLYLKTIGIYTDNDYSYGSEWLKETLPSDIEELVNAICDAIEEAEEAAKDRRVNVMPDTELLVYADENSDDLPDWVDSEDTTLVALGLAKILNLSLNELSDISHEGGNRWTVQRTEYLAGTDEDMTKELADNIRESVWAFNAEFIAAHCSVDIDTEMIKMWQEQKCEYANDAILRLIDDFDEFVEDAKGADTRANFLNRGDGTEDKATVDGVDIYAYQQ